MEQPKFSSEFNNEPNYEIYKQQLLFECDRLAIVSMAAHHDSKIRAEANQEIEDIREAWYDDTWETLF